MPSPDRPPSARSQASIHLISADLPELACRLVCAVQRPVPMEDEPPLVVDLTGEQLLAASGQRLHPLHSFEAVPVALRLWEGVRPGVDDWLRLLALADREALLVPPLPGVEALLQCLFLAEQLADQEARRQRLTVLLPPPAAAMALLELARTGPDLVEGLLDPLLSWWDRTRESLGGLGKLVGLDLPDAASLRLDEGWRGRLERLARALTDPGAHQLTLCLEAGDGEGRLTGHRLGRLALRGGLPSRLLLHGETAEEVSQTLSPPLTTLVVSRHDTLDALATRLQEAVGEPVVVAMEAGAGTLTLPLPGLRKEELQVRQVGDVIVLLSGGHRRLVTLPPPLAGRKCVGANLEAGRLELRFQDPDPRVRRSLQGGEVGERGAPGRKP